MCAPAYYRAGNVIRLGLTSGEKGRGWASDVVRVRNRTGVRVRVRVRVKVRVRVRVRVRVSCQLQTY